MKAEVWTVEAVRALGVRTTVPIAGEILAGLSTTQAYELAKRGDFPVPVVKVGRRSIVPVAPILALLHLGQDPAAGPSNPAADTDTRQTTAERSDNAQGMRRELRAIRN